MPAALLKKRLLHKRFPMNFAKFLRTSFFTEHLWATASVVYVENDFYKIFIYFFCLYYL